MRRDLREHERAEVVILREGGKVKRFFEVVPMRVEGQLAGVGDKGR